MSTNIDKNTILSKIMKNKEFIDNFGVERIALFGSYSKNLQNSESDIDFVINFYEKKKTFDNFIGLNLFLEDILGKKVDIVTIESMQDDFFQLIANDIIYAY